MRGPNWTADQVLTLEEMLAEGVSDRAIARHLGRSVTAIHVARKRYGVPCRRRLIMTQRGVARLMGIACSKTVSRWINEGWLRARAGAVLGNGRERYVIRDDLLRFLEDPARWHVWRPEPITDPDLRAWATEIRAHYLTVGEVARRLKVGGGTVNAWIHKGLLPACRWGNWLVREDALIGFVPPCERPRRRTA